MRTLIDRAAGKGEMLVPTRVASTDRRIGPMTEEQIAAFWQSHPCGDQFVPELRRADEAFFAAYDSQRYRHEAHIPRCLDAMAVAGKRTLEIGLGQGAESEQLIRRGAIWSGLDLTRESVMRVRLRLMLRGLPYEDVKEGSVLRIPYEPASFDLVFSHGVLHHVPDILGAQREIRRVLKPNGRLVVMLYARYSLNYLFSIGLLRRLGLVGLVLAGRSADPLLAAHLERARELGLMRYLRMRNFIHRNTDGPDNPYSKVYSLHDVRRDFPLFRIERAHKEYMHAPPLRAHGWAGAALLGWHLWVHLRPQ